MLLIAQQRALEMVAKGESLTAIFEELCDTIDTQSREIISFVMLMDPDGKQLRHAAGKRIPSGLASAISPFPIGPGTGSWDTAAFLKKLMVVSDIASDPLWADFRDLALSHGLHSAWSQPIVAKNGEVIGTCGICNVGGCSPNSSAFQLLEAASHVAAIAIDGNRADAALKESEERFYRMADALAEAVWITALEPESIQYASPSFERIWGRPVEEFYGNTNLWRDAIHPEDRERVGNLFARWVSGQDVSYDGIEYRITRPDGEVRWIRARGVLTLEHGKPHRASGIATDITEPKRAEETLRRSEQQLRDVIETIPAMAWSTFPDGNVDFANQRWAEYTGPALKDVSGLGWKTAIHSADFDAYQEKCHISLDTGKPFESEVRIRRFSDGEYRWFLNRAVALRGERGEIVGWYGTATDIEDSKRAEEALRKSESYLAEAQRLAHTGSWAWNVARMQIVYWSREHYHLFGLDPDGGPPPVEVFFERIHPDDRDRIRASFDQHAFQGASNIDVDFRVLLPDETLKYIHSIGHPVCDASGEPIEYVGTAVDVTEEHDASAALEMAFAEIKKLKDQLFEENILLKEEVDRASMFEEIVGESPALHLVLSRVAKVAPIDSTVLVTGETGTGKELIARAIHKRSQRAARAFVSVNCSAIPSSLIASELFGHEKGAFTGAIQRRLGRFELADGGTIFLDEIGELSQETQIALLRVLQEREFERVGGSKLIRSNVRVIAATNRDLTAAVEAGSFRSDLYYRLNVFPIHVPSLQERRADIPLLVEYFIGRYAAKAGKYFGTISRTTLDRLCSYDWPGNVRELQNVIERSVIVCDTENFVVDKSWLSPRIAETDHCVRPLFRMSASQEKKLIENALAEARGRVAGASGAAAKLGIPPSTLDSKIAAFKINKHQFKRV
jgi:PAS domain S-box-containing protein